MPFRVNLTGSPKLALLFYFAAIAHGNEDDQTIGLGQVRVLQDGNAAGPVVEIEQGKMEGRYFKTRKDRKFAGFMGIPYAMPPVGERRFMPPVACQPWEGVLDATQIHPMCPQKDAYKASDTVLGDENCLFLNVYTPQLPNGSSLSLPVMIFIHGGGYFTGSGNFTSYGPSILLDRNIVLVVFNYRLGALGFFSTGDGVVSGNNGLKDQAFAMVWVKKNIAKFGGDPRQITIFGEASGASSVHLHMLSPLSRGLFQRAISQSGTALNSWAIDLEKDVVSNSKRLATMLNCSNESHLQMVECLRKVDFKMFVIPEKTPFDGLADFTNKVALTFKPTLEPKSATAFISEPPAGLIRANQSAHVPWLTGFNTEEGALIAAIIYNTPGYLEMLDKNFSTIAPELLDYKNDVRKDNITASIREFYFADRKMDNWTRLNLIDMFTDAKHLLGTHEAVRLHTTYTRQPLYYYLFGHRGVASFSELYGNTAENYGVCHGDELQYLFPITQTLFPGKQLDVFDRRIVKLLTTTWTNFAKTGDPTPKTFNVPLIPHWRPITSDDMECYYIGGNTHMGKALLLARAKFWRNLFKQQ